MSIGRERKKKQERKRWRVRRQSNSEVGKSERKKEEKDIFFSSCLKIFRSYEDVHVTWLLTLADERLQN